MLWINSPAVIRRPINSNLGWAEHLFQQCFIFLTFWLKLWRHGNKFSCDCNKMQNLRMEMFSCVTGYRISCSCNILAKKRCFENKFCKWGSRKDSMYKTQKIKTADNQQFCFMSWNPCDTEIIFCNRWYRI